MGLRSAARRAILLATAKPFRLDWLAAFGTSLGLVVVILSAICIRTAQALAARSGRNAVGILLVFAAQRGEQLALAPCATRLDSG